MACGGALRGPCHRNVDGDWAMSDARREGGDSPNRMTRADFFMNDLRTNILNIAARRRATRCADAQARTGKPGSPA